MTFRLLFAAALALMMAMAPLGMPAMAEAATPKSHHGATASQGFGHAEHGGKAAGGHCDQQPRPDEHHKAADKSCCAAMCIAMVVPAGVMSLPSYHAARQRPASDIDRRGFLDEIATPPPRLA